MQNNFEKYIIVDSNNVYINSNYAEAYIPISLFGDPSRDATVASEYGDGIRTVGLFHIRFYDSDEAKRESVPLGTFTYPSILDTYPNEKETATLSLNDQPPEKYMVLKYYKGDILMKRYLQQDVSNCEKFLNLITKGKVPNTIPYDEVIFDWVKNFRINNINPGVPAVDLELILSEMYRAKDDPSISFRKIAGQEGTSLLDYIMLNMNEVSANTSVMSGLIFEQFGHKIASGINMTKDNTKQNKSPLEDVVTM